jgi:hypothetical protein
MAMAKDSILVKFLVPIASAIVTGFVVYFLTPGWAKTARQNGWIPPIEWKEKARSEHWVPKSECAAYPVRLQITSPGDKSSVSVAIVGNKTSLRTDFVIHSSRPIPSANKIGIIVFEEGRSNYYVIFPEFVTKDRRRVFRREVYLYMPFEIKHDSKIKFWALLIENLSSIGEVYSNIEQIKGLPVETTISEPILVNTVIQD